MSGAGAREAIELTFVYTEEEYNSASRFFHWRGRDPKFERILMGVFGAIVVLIFVLAGDLYLGVMMVGLMLAALALLYFLHRARPRRDPRFREPFSVSFAEEGIGIRSTDFEVKYEWSYFRRLLETPEFLFLVYDEEQYFFVPKRALGRGRGEAAALGELLRRKFGARMETRGLPESEAREIEYVPPREPPDWR